NAIVVLPRITPQNLGELLAELPAKRFLAANIGQLRLLRERGDRIFLDHTFHIFNTRAAKEFPYAERITLSAELTLSQIRRVSPDTRVEVIAYGRLPLMLTENCLIQNAHGGCIGKCKAKGLCRGSVTDRTGTVFPLRSLPGCRNELLNSKPVVMSDKLDDLKRCGVNAIRLLFTDETPEVCAAVLKNYKTAAAPTGDFTRGKFYHGVE
ncbi:MAG: U32 family peptidase, partial [Clostridiales bacterium]|nr:U32 family peptidase [Clostridiales bacterium]